MSWYDNAEGGGRRSRRNLSPDPPGEQLGTRKPCRTSRPSLTGVDDPVTDYQTMQDEYDQRMHSRSYEEGPKMERVSSRKSSRSQGLLSSKSQEEGRKMERVSSRGSCRGKGLKTPTLSSKSEEEVPKIERISSAVDEMDEETRKWLQQNTMSCPRCTVPVERADNQKDEMFCVTCGCVFCYSCGAEADRCNCTHKRSSRSKGKLPKTPTLSSKSSADYGGPRKHNYRGFSTSIGDMFVHPDRERVDCCAMTCCGIFQSDRDRYLIQGVEPPSPWKRIWVHFCLPLILFFMAGWAAIHIPDKYANELMVWCFLLMLVFGIIGQCGKGRIKRTDIRKDILWYKYQLAKNKDRDDHNELSLDQILDQPRPHNGDTHYYHGQTERDIGCSHPYCFLMGCYANDKPSTLTATADDNPVEESLCSCIFRFFCGRPCCGHFVQLGGVCGMAQESREIETALLPPAYRSLDYITMQPRMQYMEHIYNGRWRQFNTLGTSGADGPKAVGPFQGWASFQQLPHLSQLSMTLLKLWIALTLFLGFWSVVGPLFWTHFLNGEGRRHYFSVGDYIVYLISWLVCFATVGVVVYLCEKRRPLELSVDAMIKFFACGFVLSTTLAIFYELVFGMALRLLMMIVMNLMGVQVVEDQGYEIILQQPLLSMGFGGGSQHHYLGITAAATGADYLPVFGRDHPFVYSIYLWMNAYCLAALVEELCKYFGYRMMEHPDFLDRKELEEAAQAGSLGGEEGGTSAGEKGTSRRTSFQHHGRSLEAQGAAITVAMVCVALGVSVCEDLIYVFFYNGSSVEMELYVLVARTLFPIHPISAALQSIGVCERDVEKNPTRIGKILLPALLFHGTYDFLLLWIDFLASLKRSDGYDNVNSDEALEIGTYGVVASYLTSAIIMGAAIYWFIRESTKQRERLAARDAGTAEFSAM